MRLEYTKNAAMVISFAKEAAETLGQGTVGTEHLLIGCLWEEEGLAARVLKENNLNQEAIEKVIQDTMISEHFWEEGTHHEFTPKAEAVLENSEAQARYYGASRIGTEHILLSLLKTKECAAVRMLEILKMNIQKIFVDILQTI